MSVLSSLTDKEVREVVEIMLRHESGIVKYVQAAIDELQPAVDPLEVAVTVRLDLEGMALDDIMNRSGSHRYGYTYPEEAADEMLGNIIEKHLGDADKYKQMSRPRDVIRCRLGILKGLYDFDTESESEAKEYLEDSAWSVFSVNLADLKRDSPNDIDSEVKEFLLENCAEWQSTIVKNLLS